MTKLCQPLLLSPTGAKGRKKEAKKITVFACNVFLHSDESITQFNNHFQRNDHSNDIVAM